MLKKYLLLAAGCLLLALPARAEVKPFAELWNNIAYYDTNTEKKGFTSVLGRLQGKLGVSPFDFPLQVYGVYYITTSPANDSWDNATYAGVGVRLHPFAGYQPSGGLDAWVPKVKLFLERLTPSYQKGSGPAETDTQYGFDLWHEWNLDKADPNESWGELWTNLTVPTNNYAATNFNGYLFYFQPKIGRHLGRGVEPYIKADVIMSNKTDYWLNVATYGVGIRFEPWRGISDANELVRKFKMFAEVLSVSYLKDSPTDPNKSVGSDARLGVDFSFGR